MKRALAVLICVCAVTLSACSMKPVEAPSHAPASEASVEPSPTPTPDPHDTLTEPDIAPLAQESRYYIRL